MPSMTKTLPLPNVVSESITRSNTSHSTNLVPQYNAFQEKAIIVLKKFLRFNANYNTKGIKKIENLDLFGKAEVS